MCKWQLTIIQNYILALVWCFYVDPVVTWSIHRPGQSLFYDYDLYDIEFDSGQGNGVILPRIMPGTKWCGDGNIAINYDDLGKYNSVDKCCRQHDTCDDYIPANETRHNLANKSSYTILNCHCDKKFHHCLKEANHVLGKFIGNIYFNKLSKQCFNQIGNTDKYEFTLVQKW